MAPSAQNKNLLRQNAFRKRMTLPAAVQKQAAQDMTKNFLKHVSLTQGMTIAGYWPVQAEINVLPLLTQLLQQGYACALPQVIATDKPLVFRSWHEKTKMRINTYQIKEPDPAAASIVTPDVIIVPLLAFDHAGHRLGYGAGLYDRTLSGLKGRTVGVAFESQRVDKIPHEGHDRRLDMIVTDRNIYTFDKE